LSAAADSLLDDLVGVVGCADGLGCGVGSETAVGDESFETTSTSSCVDVAPISVIASRTSGKYREVILSRTVPLGTASLKTVSSLGSE
jgi:hypothetical protein